MGKSSSKSRNTASMPWGTMEVVLSSSDGKEKGSYHVCLSIVGDYFQSLPPFSTWHYVMPNGIFLLSGLQ